MRILLVDDDADIRKIARLSLEAVGKHEVTLAATGPEGVALAATILPELVLLDVMMPGMDGLAVLAELRRVPGLADVPVIFMTAKIQRTEAEEYVRQGAAGVIAKPFDPMLLPTQIQEIVSGRAPSA